jgi:hypothetical protein
MVLDPQEITEIVQHLMITEPWRFEDMFTAYLFSYHGITTEQFDKMIKSTIPEEVL